MSTTELKLNGTTVLSENAGVTTLSTAAAGVVSLASHTTQVSNVSGTAGNINFTTPNAANVFTVKTVDAAITDSQSGTAPDISDSDSGQLAIYNGTTKLWGITEHGYQTNPNMPLFSCGSPINSASATGVLKNLKIFHNPGNHYDSSTGLYTAPISGYYLIYHWFMNDSSGQMDVYSIYNGVRDQVGTTYGGNISQFAHASGSYIRYLSAGDAIGLQTAQTVYHSTDGRHGAFGAILIG